MTRQERNEAKMRADIERVGWHVILVPEDDRGPGFAYSIGLWSTFQHPEVVVLGLDLFLMGRMINHAGSRIRAGERFSDGQRVAGLIDHHHCLFVDVHPKFFDDYFGQALVFHEGRAFDVLQILWPDRDGTFPTEPHYPDALRQRQELGTMSSG